MLVLKKVEEHDGHFFLELESKIMKEMLIQLWTEHAFEDVTY